MWPTRPCMILSTSFSLLVSIGQAEGIYRLKNIWIKHSGSLFLTHTTAQTNITGRLVVFLGGPDSFHPWAPPARGASWPSLSHRPAGKEHWRKNSCLFRVRCASLPSHPTGWTSVLWPHPPARAAGECGLAICLRNRRVWALLCLSKSVYHHFIFSPCAAAMLFHLVSKGTILIFPQGLCMYFLQT